MTRAARIYYHPSHVLVGLLRARFAPPAYALFEQVANGTGFAASRHADAIVMSIWPSRGLEILGFEVKSSRGDWKRELAMPAKADPIQAFCDRWWIVAGGDGIVEDGELPPTWGLLVADATGKKLTCKREAPKLKPKPLSREFVAAVLRRAHDSQAVLLLAELQRGIEKGVAEGPERQQVHTKGLESRIADLEKSIADFQAASGLKIDMYNGRHLGEAVKLVQSEYFRTPSRLRQLRDSAQELVKSVGKDLAIAEQLTGTEST